LIAVCLKWVDHRPEVDALTGAVHHDARTSGASAADLAALEWALRLATTWRSDVVAITAGAPSSEPLLREALAVGAARAARVDLAPDAPSEVVAGALAGALTTLVPAGLDVVTCGAWSLDRGSGSVPAFLAAHLGAAQALGLVTMSFTAEATGELRAERRLDGGRRERLRAPTPAVVSVEGGSARLRRAPLDGVLDARTMTIDVLAADGTGPTRRHGLGPARGSRAVRTRPFRPRARVLLAPSPELSARERVLALTGALSQRTPPQRLVLGAPEAADKLLGQLREWGYLRSGADGASVPDPAEDGVAQAGREGASIVGSQEASNVGREGASPASAAEGEPVGASALVARAERHPALAGPAGEVVTKEVMEGPE